MKKILLLLSVIPICSISGLSLTSCSNDGFNTPLELKQAVLTDDNRILLGFIVGSNGEDTSTNPQDYTIEEYSIKDGKHVQDIKPSETSLDIINETISITLYFSKFVFDYKSFIYYADYHKLQVKVDLWLSSINSYF